MNVHPGLIEHGLKHPAKALSLWPRHGCTVRFEVPNDLSGRSEHGRDPGSLVADRSFTSPCAILHLLVVARDKPPEVCGPTIQDAHGFVAVCGLPGDDPPKGVEIRGPRARLDGPLRWRLSSSEHDLSEV